MTRTLGQARAVAATAYHDLDALTLIETELAAPGPGQVTFTVEAAPVNPFDAKIVDGALGTDPARLPLRLGSEAAGVVTAVGEEAVALDGTRLAVGDAVYGHHLRGAQATALTVPAAELLPRPSALEPAAASGLLSVGTTAVHALESVGVGAGDTVLVHGVSGGVGTLVAQLAILRGARVVGTAAPHRHEALAARGIQPVVYGEGLADRVRSAVPDGVDAAVDTVGTAEALTVSLELVPEPARIVTIVNFAAALAAGAQAIGGGPGADPGSEVRRAARLELHRLAADGQLEVPVAATYPLTQAREAYRHVVAGHAGGKVVLLPEPTSTEM